MIKEVSENQVPIHLRARRSRFSRYFAKRTLRIFGWQVSGNIPNEERIVVVAAPHTSNWDFIIGMLTILALNVNLKWIGKSSIFKPGFQWFFKVGGLILGARGGPWLSFWGTGWLKGGWLEGWLVVAGGGFDVGWGVGWPRGPLSREPKVRGGLVVSLGGQNQHIYQEGIPYQQWTRD